MTCRTSFVLFVLTLVVTAAACSSAPTGPGDGETAQVTMAIQAVPPDGTCLQITVVGSRTVEQSFDLPVGHATTVTLRGLPSGNVLFTEAAFPGRCSSVTPASIPTWISDPTPAFLKAGAATTVNLALHRNAQANVTTDFQPDPSCVLPGGPCMADTDCCMGERCNAGSCSAVCAAAGSMCSVDSDCCTGNACVAGTCSPSMCSAQGAPCMLPTDCCSGLSCAGGVCAASMCMPPFTTCPPPSKPGCIDVNSDPTNCGKCGNLCLPGQACQAGVCACLPGQVACPMGCANVATDPNNCGMCNHVCPGLACNAGVCTAAMCFPNGAMCATNQQCCSALCNAGICQPIAGCMPPQTLCGASCVNTSSDPNNCGMCGLVCMSQACVSGICATPPPSCADGIKNGNETDVDCGGGICGPCATGKRCNVGADCTSGACSATGICL